MAMFVSFTIQAFGKAYQAIKRTDKGLWEVVISPYGYVEFPLNLSLTDLATQVEVWISQADKI